MRNTIQFDKNSRPGKNIFSRVEDFLASLEWFDNGVPVAYLPYVLFIVFLAILYIGNSHTADRMVRSIDKLESEVEDLRADYTTMKSAYMVASKQSEVAKKVAKSGLKEPVNPPVKIKRAQ